MPFINERNGNDFRTIDYDREIVLKRREATGGSSDSMDVFELYIKDWPPITFISKLSASGSGESLITHEIRQITIPKSITGEKDKVIGIIKDALNAYGYFYSKEKVARVDVHFSSDLKLQ